MKIVQCLLLLLIAFPSVAALKDYQKLLLDTPLSQMDFMLYKEEIRLEKPLESLSKRSISKKNIKAFNIQPTPSTREDFLLGFLALPVQFSYVNLSFDPYKGVFNYGWSLTWKMRKDPFSQKTPVRILLNTQSNIANVCSYFLQEISRGINSVIRPFYPSAIYRGQEYPKNADYIKKITSDTLYSVSIDINIDMSLTCSTKGRKEPIKNYTYTYNGEWHKLKEYEKHVLNHSN